MLAAMNFPIQKGKFIPGRGSPTRENNTGKNTMCDIKVFTCVSKYVRNSVVEYSGCK